MELRINWFKNVARKCGALCLLGFCSFFSLSLLHSRNPTGYLKLLMVAQKTETPLPIFDINIQMDDPQLLSHIRNTVLETPSTAPYNLVENNLNVAYYDSEAFYKKYAHLIFSKTEAGFFVEAGALNGEDMSNTLWLEMKLGWTGLLIEPDLSVFQDLRRKNRKAWAANSCLSLEKHPKVETFSYAINLQRITKFSNGTVTKDYARGMSYVNEGVDSNMLPTSPQKFQGYGNETRSYNVTCYPMESFLLALGVTKVDLLSLDVEQTEKKIIENLDFDKFDFRVIFIEWMKIGESHWLKSFMEDRGFILVDNTATDFVFVKIGTLYEEIVVREKMVQPFKLYMTH